MSTETPIDFSRCIAPLFVTPVVNYLWEDSADLNACLLYTSDAADDLQPV